MQLETGSTAPRIKPVWAELSGYDRIAIMTDARDRPRHGRRDSTRRHERRQLPIPRPDDVVEVPCAVDANGPRALPVPPVPEHCASLMTRVKEYERATIAAALSGERARSRARACR